MRALAVFMEAIDQAQAMDRHSVRDRAGEEFDSDRMQAFDGVTTALELESGILPVAAWYDNRRDQSLVPPDR